MKSHLLLGEAYLDYKCSDQAQDHLQIAYETNNEYMQSEEGERCQLYILQIMAKNNIQAKKFSQAREQLDMAEDICHLDEEMENRKKDYANIQALKASCYQNEGEYEEAINCLQKTAEIYKEIYKEDSEKYAEIIYDISELYEYKEDYELAIQYLEEAIGKKYYYSSNF